MDEYDRKSRAQRHAIYTVHGEKCYLCGDPVDMQTVEIDHLVPQSLLNDPTELQRVLKELGRPTSFNVNGFENLLPACRRCNLLKSDMAWETSELIQLRLQIARDKAEQVRQLAAKTIQRKEITAALAVLERAIESISLNKEETSALKKLTDYQLHVRKADMQGQPVRLLHIGLVASTKELSIPDVEVTTIPGFTLSLGPDGGKFTSGNVRCSNCGSSRFNGTECLDCQSLN